MQSDALLTVDDRKSVLQSYRHITYSEQRGEHHQAYSGKYKIKNSLHFCLFRRTGKIQYLLTRSSICLNIITFIIYNAEDGFKLYKSTNFSVSTVRKKEIVCVDNLFF